jgi:GTP-binding protein
MKQPASLPVVAIVGRPNVGKSTLFNCILRQRRSIVGDEPGITRDRIHGEASHRGRRFELIDTGGILPNDPDLIPSEIFRQARVALEQADHIIFLLDGRAELTSSDLELARHLRRLGRPVALAVNKIDSASRENLAHEFHSLGMGDLFPVSAEHRLGIDELLDHVTEGFPAEDAKEAETRRPPIKVAIIGRPNVGKSTLLNQLVGEDRSIVSPVAGTTRDAVDQTVQVEDTEYTFVDTAGIRRKGKTKMMAEKLSVVMARRHIRLANVVLLAMDATEGVLGLDATIAGYAHEEGRGVILCVNKWDAVPADKNRKEFLDNLRDAMKFLDYAPAVFLSAKTGAGVSRLFPLIRQIFDAASMRVTTGELNRFLEGCRMDTELKVLYITQASVRPPTFVLFTDRRGKLHFSAERYFVNRLRDRFGFQGTPIVIKTKWRHA